MNLVQAHDTARNAAERFGKPFRVYRLPKWPAAVYGATSIELPSEAVIVATYPEHTGAKSQVRSPQSPAAPADARGSLF